MSHFLQTASPTARRQEVIMRAPVRAPPPVFVAESQFDLLFDLAVTARTPAARLLEDELKRAVVVQDNVAGPAFARLGDAVRYRNLDTGRERSAVLVTPDCSDADQGRVSVLSPAGAALIGLEPGAILGWIEPDGRRHTVELLEVARS
jgi:regulator of nucleoside diphosphate kinase